MSGYRPLLVRCLLSVGLLLVATACSPTQTPVPEPTARPTLVAPTPTPTVPAATQTPVPTATATRSEEPTAMPAATQTPTATQVPTQTPTPEPTATPMATQTPTATQTQLPAATQTPSPASTTTSTRLPAAPATPTPVAGGWRGEYYANANLAGDPALVRTDSAVGFDWGNDAPAPGLPSEGFSVRWTRVATFGQGLYRFHATVDDGMRLWVDDELLIDEWRDRSLRTVTASRQMSAGNHALRVEYYDRQHRAVANLWWEQDAAYPDWKGVYWANPDLLGNPALIRNDPQIDFDWGLNSPGASIPNDYFSARWTRTVNLEEGLYRFFARVDDGLRIWVDELLVLDAWSPQSRELTVDYAIGGTAAHTIRIEYYDQEFEARAHVSMSKVAEAVYNGWKGEYYANPYLGGAPTLVRNDDSLTFDWEWGSPAPSLPVDGFSVRWTREREFTPGVYRFALHADDGVRFWVNDNLVLDEWHQTWDIVYEVDVELNWKPKLRVEMYEDTGDARFRLTWTRIR